MSIQHFRYEYRYTIIPYIAPKSRFTNRVVLGSGIAKWHCTHFDLDWTVTWNLIPTGRHLLALSSRLAHVRECTPCAPPPCSQRRAAWWMLTAIIDVVARDIGRPLARARLLRALALLQRIHVPAGPRLHDALIDCPQKAQRPWPRTRNPRAPRTAVTLNRRGCFREIQIRGLKFHEIS